MEENPEDNGNKPIKTNEIPAVDESAMIHNLKGEQCESCDTIVENENELNIHKKHTHGIECHNCWIQVEKESDVKEHKRLYHSPRCLKCDNYSVSKFRDMYCHHCSSDLGEKYSKRVNYVRVAGKCWQMKMILKIMRESPTGHVKPA